MIVDDYLKTLKDPNTWFRKAFDQKLVAETPSINTGTGTCFVEKGIELQAVMSVAQFFFVSFYILIWLVKTILLYLPAERGN